MVSPAILAACTPVHAVFEGPQAAVRWAYMQDMAFEEPFFAQTVSRAFHENPQRLRLRTGPQTLRQVYETSPGVAPDGFILHMTHCGSTLVARSLASLPGTRVYSEAQPVGAALEEGDRADGGAAAVEAYAERLRHMIGALCQPLPATPCRFFVKLVVWNAAGLRALRMAFPGTRWIFVYRDPVEVMAANERGDAALFPHIPAAERRDAFLPAVGPYLARACEAALQAPAEHRRLVSYAELPRAIPDIIRFFGVPLSNGDEQALASVWRVYSKDPRRSTPFVGDGLTVSQPARQAAERWLREPYERLEQARLAGAGL